MRQLLAQPSIAPAWLPGATRWNEASEAISEMRRRARQVRRVTPDNTLRLGYDEVRLTTEDGLGLAAWYVPARANVGAVILHHHYGGQKAYTLPWIRVFNRLGLSCLAIDGRGHGGSDDPPGVDSLVTRGADARAAFTYLRDRGHARIVAFGQSQGAAVLLLGLARADACAFILDSGPSPELVSATWGVASMLLPARRSRALLTTRVLLASDPVRYSARLFAALRRQRRRPLLWLHGDDDAVISRAAARIWFDAVKPAGDLWQSLQVPGADHVRTLQHGGAPVEEAVGRLVARL